MDSRPDAAEQLHATASDDSPHVSPMKKHRHLTTVGIWPQERASYSPSRSQDAVFSPTLAGLEIEAGSDPKQTVELLKSKVTELEKELYRRRISLSIRDQPSPPSPSTESMEISVTDLVPSCWKDEEIVRLQSEVASLKLSKDQQESSHLHGLSSCLEENTRLKTELNTAKTFMKQAEAAQLLELEVKELSEKLMEMREEGKRRDCEVEMMGVERNKLESKVDILENEVYAEKQHSVQIQHTMSEAMKQLLASKALCESDLSALQEQHLRLVTDSAKVEQNLRTQISDLLQECRTLKSKQEVPPEYEELCRQLEAKEKEYETLSGKVATLEDKLIQISCQLAEERKRHFDLQNVMSQDNELLKNEIEAMKKQIDLDTRELDSLSQSLELSEHRIQGESRLHSDLDSLRSQLQSRESDIQQLLIALEEMRIKERHWEQRCTDEEARTRDKAEEERKEESDMMKKVMKEKNEAERTTFDEIQKRVKAEEKLFVAESSHRKSEEENAHLRLQIATMESEFCRHCQSVRKRRSFQESSEALSPLKSKLTRPVQLFQLNEVALVGEATPQPTDTREVSFPEPAKSPDAPRSKRSTKDSLSNSPCNCSLW